MPRKETGFVERLQTAANAKQAQMEKLRATAQANETHGDERQAARIEVAESRTVRLAERREASVAAAKLRDAQRAAEKAKQAQALAEERARNDAARVVQENAAAGLKQGQKAMRDAKYAARKARQK